MTLDKVCREGSNINHLSVSGYLHIIPSQTINTQLRSVLQPESYGPVVKIDWTRIRLPKKSRIRTGYLTLCSEYDNLQRKKNYLHLESNSNSIGIRPNYPDPKHYLYFGSINQSIKVFYQEQYEQKNKKYFHRGEWRLTKVVFNMISPYHDQ